MKKLLLLLFLIIPSLVSAQFRMILLDLSALRGADGIFYSSQTYSVMSSSDIDRIIQHLPNVITSTHVADGTITDADLANGYLRNYVNIIYSSHIAPNTITAADLAELYIQHINSVIVSTTIKDGSVAPVDLSVEYIQMLTNVIVASHTNITCSDIDGYGVDVQFNKIETDSDTVHYVGGTTYSDASRQTTAFLSGTSDAGTLDSIDSLGFIQHLVSVIYSTHIAPNTIAGSDLADTYIQELTNVIYSTHIAPATIAASDLAELYIQHINSVIVSTSIKDGTVAAVDLADTYALASQVSYATGTTLLGHLLGGGFNIRNIYSIDADLFETSLSSFTFMDDIEFKQSTPAIYYPEGDTLSFYTVYGGTYQYIQNHGAFGYYIKGVWTDGASYESVKLINTMLYFGAKASYGRLRYDQTNTILFVDGSGTCEFRVGDGGSFSEIGVSGDCGIELKLEVLGATYLDGGITGGLTLNTGNYTITNGDIIMAADGKAIITDTSDGSDNQYTAIGGGGTISDSRGGSVIVYGNEDTPAGDVVLRAGDVAGASVDMKISAVLVAQADSDSFNVKTLELIDETTTTCTITHACATPQTEATDYTLANGDLRSGGATGSQYFYHCVEIPDGYAITRLDVYGVVDSTASKVHPRIARKLKTTGVNTDLGDISLTGTNTTAFTETIANRTVDNDLYNYFVYIEIDPDNNSADSVVFHSLTVSATGQTITP